MASVEEPPGATTNTSRRERQWLLPSNRKIRHLHGVTIRNLTFAQSPCRPRGRTIDDDALPLSLKTSAKLLAQREGRRLEHSKSVSDLKHSGESRTGTEFRSKPQKQDTSASIRPSIGRLRRRSTLEWANASPTQRQKKLEDIIGARLADTFFSLHVTSAEEPIYVSEVAVQTMNPSFRAFDLSIYGPDVTRLDALIVRVWAKAETMEDYQLLLELSLSLQSLQFMGKSLDHFHEPLPANSVIISLVDGVYKSSSDLSMQSTRDSTLSEATRSAVQEKPTSSYDALMRLSNLDDCIQDAISTRQKLASEIEAIIKENRNSLSVTKSLAAGHDRLLTVQEAVRSVSKQIDSVKKRREERQSTLQARKVYMHQGHQAETSARGYLSTNAEKLQLCQNTCRETAEEVRGQQRRICEDLLHIYPIDPIHGHSLAFTIRGMHLPNSEFLDVKEDIISAALGHVAHLVYLLSFYLFIPLIYPIQPYSSTSAIVDPVSIMGGNRTFPLYMKGSVMYRFEYGVFLLNKDIELLFSRQGLKILDIRQTLPNLKYLLLCIVAAGKGDLPTRKVGGVRGLLRGAASPIASPRRSQDDTTDSATKIVTWADVKGRRLPEGKGLSAATSRTIRGPSYRQQTPAMRTLSNIS